MQWYWNYLTSEKPVQKHFYIKIHQPKPTNIPCITIITAYIECQMTAMIQNTLFYEGTC